MLGNSIQRISEDIWRISSNFFNLFRSHVLHFRLSHSVRKRILHTTKKGVNNKIKVFYVNFSCVPVFLNSYIEKDKKGKPKEIHDE